MNETNDVINKALKMAPSERAKIIDHLIKSLDKPDPEIDKLWKKEAESRIEAFEKGQIEAVPLQDVIRKYKKR